MVWAGSSIIVPPNQYGLFNPFSDIITQIVPLSILNILDIVSAMDIEELAAMRIRKARRLRDMTQQQAADAVGVSQNAWATYENGTRGVSLKMLQKIAEMFALPIEFFVNPNYEIVAQGVEPKKAPAKRRKAA